MIALISLLYGNPYGGICLSICLSLTVFFSVIATYINIGEGIFIDDYKGLLTENVISDNYI